MQIVRYLSGGPDREYAAGFDMGQGTMGFNGCMGCALKEIVVFNNHGSALEIGFEIAEFQEHVLG